MAVFSSHAAPAMTLLACVRCVHGNYFLWYGLSVGVARTSPSLCSLRLLAAIYFSELYIRHCVWLSSLVAIALAPVVGEGSKTARPLLLLPWCVQMVGAD